MWEDPGWESRRGSLQVRGQQGLLVWGSYKGFGLGVLVPAALQGSSPSPHKLAVIVAITALTPDTLTPC